MKHSYILLILITLISGCQKIGEYYLGMNMQPDLKRDDFKPGLNVYGVLKTGDSVDTLNHFFEVEKVLFIKDMLDSIYIENVEIELTRLPVGGNDTVYHLNHIRDGIYLNEKIETAPGDRWLLQCKSDSFKVTAECNIPNLPQLKGAVQILADKTIQFVVAADTSAYMYDIYLLNGNKSFFEKRIPVKGIDTEFRLNPEWNPLDGSNLLFIFAYDLNLEKYFTTSNTFFKPNAFRPSFSTVEGGYGTFGGISCTMVVVK
jgi:hypothetical protein